MIKKRILSVIMALTMVISTVITSYSANDTEVNAGSAETAKEGGSGIGDPYIHHVGHFSGARVSLWECEVSEEGKVDTSNPHLVNKMLMVDDDPTKNMYKLYKVLSNLTKPEIIALGGQFTDTMIDQIYASGFDSYISAQKQLYEKRVEFPSLYAIPGTSGKDRREALEAYGANNQLFHIFMETLGKDLSNEELKEAWTSGKYSILVEPVVAIDTYGPPDIYNERNYHDSDWWIVTCAELGLLAKNGLAGKYGPFSTGKLSSMCYKALPFGTFKVSAERLISIEPHPLLLDMVIDSAISAGDYGAIEDMIKGYGCFEILPITNPATPSVANPTQKQSSSSGQASMGGEVGDGRTRELVLYEDELSYVYDYEDIGNADTRKNRCRRKVKGK